MKSLPFLCAVGAVFLAGCESAVDDVRSRFPGDAPTASRTFPADEAAVYKAARAALGQIGFRFTHGGQKQGEVDGVSEVGPGDAQGSSHQFTLKAHLNPTLDGTGTEVDIQLTEIIEDDTDRHPGMGTESPLRDTSLAEVFFRNLQQNLVIPTVK